MRTVILTLLVIIILLPLTSPAAEKVVVVPLSGNDSLWQKSGAGIFYDSGNVGIGTTNPGSKLVVTDLPSGTSDDVVEGSLAGALCITTSGNLYVDTDGTCDNN